MSTTAAITFTALALIICATVAVCLGHIDQAAWLAATLGSGGAAGLAHVTKSAPGGGQ